VQVILQSVTGGLLIGAAVAGLLLVNGRIAGVSGILFAATSRTGSLWQWAFLAGLAFAGVVSTVFGAHPAPALERESLWLLAGAGGLVGIGTRLANGCTSGHGVCGLGNLSVRSLAATLTFMATGAATVFATHNIPPVHRLLSSFGV